MEWLAASGMKESWIEQNTPGTMRCSLQDTIKENVNELYRLMNGMELREMDKIIYPVCTLCRDHQRSGFVEGVKVGIRLREELEEN